MSAPIKKTYHLLLLIAFAALCLWLAYFLLITTLDFIDKFVPWP
jgi:hypothetical protein